MNARAGHVLLAALAGVGAGVLGGVLLAPTGGAATRQNLKDLAHKYVGLASEQQQEASHHLAERATRLGCAYKDLKSSCLGYLQRWGLLPEAPRRPY
ncbi:YtxH domain-containing protein [Hymenobacter caeli]|uniref:Gas vesicle protein n=2 Tax=Hymenobacter caeli TaxID=2735894 RepID=A0ABX2FSY5_9BACT|nr:YtxH domain-containing protein [Hymenobacter caeli]NRT19584.1 gas vesicle protein [Hymenobacter caeli]